MQHQQLKPQRPLRKDVKCGRLALIKSKRSTQLEYFRVYQDEDTGFELPLGEKEGLIPAV